MHTQANARRTLGIAVVILIAAAFTGTGIAQTSKGARAAAPSRFAPDEAALEYHRENIFTGG